MMRSIFLILVMLTPLVSQASWWNEGWAYRKQILIDTSVTGANITADMQNVPVLVKLHTGNFSYFLDIQPNGEDIRFVLDDHTTPLKYHVEHFDAINEIGLIWVQLPVIEAGQNTASFYMYYGSQSAVAGDDPAGTYTEEQTLVYHFKAGKTAPEDATSYANGVSAYDAEMTPGAIIGDGVTFSGETSMTIADAPVLAVDASTGWTFTSWIKIDAEQTDAILLERDGGNLVMGVDGTALYARVGSIETPRTTELTTGRWHHVAMTLDTSGITLYLDGEKTTGMLTEVPAITGDITIGGSAQSTNYFVGSLDEMNLANVSRSPLWYTAAIRTQGPLSNLLIYGEDGSQESDHSGTSHFDYVLTRLTFDAKVVIVFLLVMSAISWVVMVMKWLYLKKIVTDNRNFLEAYYSLGTDDPTMLDSPDTEEDKEIADSPMASAIFGDHDKFQSSPIFHMYHRGVAEVKARLGTAVGAQATGISDQSIEALRAALDADMVRESQKINSKMVLLTIAISGGPFIGLLGTVIGVMITFAEMASTGDVSIASIAPGMAAALLATIAGLWVAIPALFGYNYLGSQIKDIQADMRVFIDEYVTRVAEYYGKL